MSSLTIALASLGGVVLAGLIAHGAWQAHKAGPKRAVPVPEPREPVMDGWPPVDGAPSADQSRHDGVDLDIGGDAGDHADGIRAARSPADGSRSAGSAADGAETPSAADGTRTRTRTGAGDRAAAPATGRTAVAAHADGTVTTTAIFPVDVSPRLPERRAVRRLVARLDGLVDAIATLGLDAPLSGAVALGHLSGSRRAGSKPLLIEGRNAETGAWEPLNGSQRYVELQAGVQLANRTGAINEIEYSEFVQKVQTFAEAVGAMPDFPDMLEAVAAARELDGFASQHDAQLAVHLQARTATWSVGYIQQTAARHGFVSGVVPGRLVLPAAEDGAPPVLMLTFDSQAALADDPDRAAVRDVTLSFDVPQTEPAAGPFAAWQVSAAALADSLEATIVDDNGRPLGSDSFSAIGDELGRLYDALEARDLAAGSPAARRLFS